MNSKGQKCERMWIICIPASVSGFFVVIFVEQLRPCPPPAHWSIPSKLSMLRWAPSGGHTAPISSWDVCAASSLTSQPPGAAPLQESHRASRSSLLAGTLERNKYVLLNVSSLFIQSQLFNLGQTLIFRPDFMIWQSSQFQNCLIKCVCILFSTFFALPLECDKGQFWTTWMQAWQKLKLKPELTPLIQCIEQNCSPPPPSLCSMHAVHKQTNNSWLTAVCERCMKNAARLLSPLWKRGRVAAEGMLHLLSQCTRPTGHFTSVAASFYSVLYFPQTSSFPKTLSSAILLAPSMCLCLVLLS